MKRNIASITSGKGRRSLFVKAAAIFIALCMIAALALPAFASDTYTYTVRIFTGNIGEFTDGSSVYVETGIKPGTRWSYDWQKNIKVKDGDQYKKYYIKGLRESGRDNNTVSGSKEIKPYYGSFIVDRDTDLVVAYGIKNNQVAYKVQYVDAASGKTLHKEETYYGNVGDKPVTAFLYVEGYTPQYYNITATLGSKESDNSWTFKYNKLEPVKSTKTTTKAGTTSKTSTKSSTTTTRTTVRAMSHTTTTKTTTKSATIKITWM